MVKCGMYVEALHLENGMYMLVNGELISPEEKFRREKRLLKSYSDYHKRELERDLENL